MQFATSIVDQLGHLQRYLLTPLRPLGRAACLVPLIGAAITVGFPPSAYGQGTGVIEIEFVEENADLAIKINPAVARAGRAWNVIKFFSVLCEGSPFFA